MKLINNFSIIHISDLHRIRKENIECLISSFEVEKNRYANEGLPPVRLIVVSGDIVNGSNEKDGIVAKQEIQEQYTVASLFLNNLCDLFIGKEPADRLRVIIVPGNHDMSRYMSKISMEMISHNDIGTLSDSLWANNTDIRWNWGDLHFYKITDWQKYNNRFDDFIEFYNSFYQGQRNYPSDPDRQSDLIDIPELNLSLACFNSCYRLDHLRHSGYISPRSLSQLTNPLLSSKNLGRLIIGVWHHHTHGLPNENNYLDYSILENMVQNGISLALHGHQHISGIVNEYKDVFSDAKLNLISAGTLYGNSDDLPIGKMRQYNLLTVSMKETESVITLYSIEDTTPLNEMPSWEPGAIGRSKKASYPFVIKKEPAQHMSEESDLQERINQINLLVERSGDILKGVELLEKLDKSNPLVRKFLLDYLERSENYDKLCSVFHNPMNVAETISVIEGCLKTKNSRLLLRILDSNIVKSSDDASLKAVVLEALLSIKKRN